MKPIAISHPWFDLKNAEYEVLQRFIKAAEMISVSVIVVDMYGVILWHSKDTPAIIGKNLEPDQVQFLISLHFQSPKILDVYSYYTLWQPIDFYEQAGYDKTIRSVCSHNDLISCDSDVADAHGLNIFNAMGRALPKPLPEIFHTLPQPFLPPQIDQNARLFYIGVNWERLGRAKGRFHDALLALDKKGFVDIYGPELVHGIAPWAGFASYQGELPFDGESIKFALNRSGICLALSSKSHVDAGIMSNRLFEGFAGGAAVICNKNPFIDKHFANEVYIVDSENGEQYLAMQISQIVQTIRSNPHEAIEKVRRAQEIMKEKFALDQNLRNLIEAHQDRFDSYCLTQLAETAVTVIADFRNNDLSGITESVASLARQKKVSIDLYILCNASVVPVIQGLVTKTGRIRFLQIDSVGVDDVPAKFGGVAQARSRRGELVNKILRGISTPYFAFATPADCFFSDHFGKVVSAIQKTDGAFFGLSSVVAVSASIDGKTTKTLQDQADRHEDFINVALPFEDTSRFVFDSRLIKMVPDELFKLLNGSEPLFFQAMAATRGAVARTFQPTLQSNLQVRSKLSLIDDVERRHIKDYLMFQSDWLMESNSNIARRELQAVNERHRSDSAFPRIRTNVRYETKAGAEGIKFLVSGFSYPEADFIWCLERGIIDFSLPEIRRPDRFGFVFRIMLVSLSSHVNGRPQFVTVAFNGAVIGYYSTTGLSQSLDIHLPICKLPDSIRFRLELIPDHAEPRYGASGEITDHRPLSFRVSSFVLEQKPFVSLPVFDIGELISFTRGQYGTNALAQGFYSAEENLTWMAGTKAIVLFYVGDDIVRGRLVVSVISRSSLATEENQSLTIILNGRRFEPVELQEGESECVFDFETSFLKGDLVELEFNLEHAEAVFDEDHNILDPRFLGLALVSLSVISIESEASKELPPGEAVMTCD